jgi:metal-responsive CopG/Arc/MetJ family transcriptional regulator
MSKSKIAITMEETTLGRLDELVEQSKYPSRSQAIEEAVEEKLARLEGNRLARECAKLNPDFEKALAEEGLSEEISRWPEY